MKINVPYLSTVWATGSFNYEQHTAKHPLLRSLYLGENYRNRRKRCFIPSPFYLERSMEIEFKGIQENYVIFDTVEPPPNEWETTYMLTESGDFYKKITDEEDHNIRLLQNIAKMNVNDVFENLQFLVDAGENCVHLRENHPVADQTYWMRKIGRESLNGFPANVYFLGGYLDLEEGAVIYAEEDRKPEQLMKLAENIIIHNNVFWQKTDEPLIFSFKPIHHNVKPQHYLMHKSQHGFFGIEAVMMVNIHEERCEINATMHIQSLWNNISDIRVLVREGDESLLQRDENRDLSLMYEKMKENHRYTEVNPLQADKAPEYRR